LRTAGEDAPSARRSIALGLAADLRAPVDAGTIWQGHNFTFITDAGFFDCLASPEEGASTAYDDLAQNAATVMIANAPIRICSLEDLIRMKQAAGRAKDLIEVEVLKAVLAVSRHS
jgi:hypothetical protein